MSAPSTPGDCIYLFFRAGAGLRELSRAAPGSRCHCPLLRAIRLTVMPARRRGTHTLSRPFPIPPTPASPVPDVDGERELGDLSHVDREVCAATTSVRDSVMGKWRPSRARPAAREHRPRPPMRPFLPCSHLQEVLEYTRIYSSTHRIQYIKVRVRVNRAPNFILIKALQ